MIDVSNFANTEAGAMETKFVAVDAGEYVAMIPQGAVPEAPKKTQVDGEDRYVLDINWEISKDDPKYEAQKKKTGMSNVRVRQSIFLDLVERGGKTVLANGPGQNIQLGRLRAAVGQNDPAKKWSPQHLEGVVARIKVENRIYECDTYAQVAKKDGVTKL